MKKIILTALVAFGLSGYCLAQSFTFGDCTAAANPQNPYDNIGVQHNSQLEVLMQTLNNNQLSDFNTVLNAELTNASSIYSPSEIQNFRNSNIPSQIEAYISTLNTRNAPTALELIGNTGLSRGVTTSLNSIVTEIYNTDPNNFDYNSAKLSIMNWEKTIGDGKYSESEKKSLYAFGSTLRYSLLGWTNSTTSVAGRGLWAKIKHALTTAVGDAIGALIGMGGTPIAAIA